MYRAAVFFEGIWLAPSSEAKRLYDEKKFKELRLHLKQVDQKEKELLKRYE